MTANKKRNKTGYIIGACIVFRAGVAVCEERRDGSNDDNTVITKE